MDVGYTAHRPPVSSFVPSLILHSILLSCIAFVFALHCILVARDIDSYISCSSDIELIVVWVFRRDGFRPSSMVGWLKTDVVGSTGATGGKFAVHVLVKLLQGSPRVPIFRSDIIDADVLTELCDEVI